MKTLVLLLTIVAGVSGASGASNSNLLGIVAKDHTSRRLFIVNCGPADAAIKLVDVRVRTSAASSDTAATRNQSIWFEEPYVLKSHTAVCAASLPLAGDAVDLQVAIVGAEAQNIVVCCVDAAGAWVEMDAKGSTSK